MAVKFGVLALLEAKAERGADLDAFLQVGATSLPQKMEPSPGTRSR
jgi:hypothetical protein